MIEYLKKSKAIKTEEEENGNPHKGMPLASLINAAPNKTRSGS